MPTPSLSTLLRHAALAACTALIAACAATPSGGSNERIALVIGNAAYENAPALNNPVNDATDMCAALRGVGFRSLCHTNVRDRAEFDAIVKDYVDQLRPDSVGVFYYAGHAVQASNVNFLIPTQVQLRTATQNPLHELYSVDDLFDRLRQKSAGFQLVILDACRTDFFASAPRPSARGVNTVAGSSLARSLESVTGASYGLAPIKDAPPATIVLYATASREAAFDGEGRNGPLTKHILQHIGTYALPVDDFVKLVMLGVANETARDYGKRQTPSMYSLFSGKFCFAGCRGDPPVTIVP